MVKETDIQRDILAWLAAQGILAWRMGMGGLKTGTGTFRKNPAKGLPDILGILKPSGRLLAIEVKTAKGKPSLDQLRWLDDFAKAGALAILARSVDDVMHALIQP